MQFLLGTTLLECSHRRNRHGDIAKVLKQEAEIFASGPGHGRVIL
jgi:hypothetical protein